MLNQFDDHAATEQNEKLVPLYMVREIRHEKLLNAVVETCTDVINQRILPNNFLTLKMPDLIGSTTLHFAEQEYNTKLLYLLLDKGADYCIKNSKHRTVVHEALIRSSYCKDYLDYDLRGLLPDQEPYCFDCPFVDAILNLQVNLGNPMNPCDENGLSHFHIACLTNSSEAVELFLKNGVSSDAVVSENSSIWPGLSPLHIAAKHHSYSVVDVLLKNNADKNVRDSRGMSCLHILLEERLKYSFCNSMRKRLRQDQTVFLINSNANKMTVEVLLGKAATWDPNVTDDIGLSYLHVACTLQNNSIIEELIQKASNINQAVNMDAPMWSGYTALHFAAHFDIKTVSLLIKHGADLGMADTKGLTPFDICLQRFTPEEICSLLKLKTDWESIVFSDGKTKLFDLIYAMRNRNAFQEFLKNKVTNINMCVPLESCIAAGYTPLHFAVITTGIAKTNLKACENVDYQAPHRANFQNNVLADTEKYIMNIVSCLRLGADVTIQDKQGLTPLHLSFQLNEYLAACVLFTKHDKMVNLTDVNGTSHFHIACVVSETDFIKKLLSSNKNIINEPVKYSFCYHTKFLNRRVSIKISEGSTPLHIAVAMQNPVLTKLLLEYKADISAKDDKGLTPFDLAIFMDKDKTELHKAYQDINRVILKLLVKCKCKAIAQTYNSSVPLKQIFHKCDVVVRDLLLLELEQQNIIQRCVLEDMGITMLHVACAVDNFDKIQQLLDEGANVNGQIHLDSPIWPGCTPLHILMSLTPREVDSTSLPDQDLVAQIPVGLISLNPIDYSAAVPLLLNHGADVTIENAEKLTPIHVGFESLWYGKDKCSLKLSLTKKFHLCASYELLIKAQKNFTVDPASMRGMSHFHVACALDEVQTVKQFLQHGVDLSQKINSFSKHFGGYTPLHFAVHCKSKSTVDLLLEHGADINGKDVMGNTPLHIFAKHSSSCVDILESLLSNGANMNITNLTGNKCFETILQPCSTSEAVEAINIFKKHGCLFNSYNAITKEGCLTILLDHNDKKFMENVFNALDIVAEDDMGRTLIHNLVTITKHGGEYTTEERYIDDEFISWENYWMAIGKLTKHGVDINHQDKEGLTALHIAAQRRNYSGIIGLLKNGADVNVTDAAGKTAFVYSAEIAADSKNVCGFTPVDRAILSLCLKHVLKMLTFKLEMITQNVQMCDGEKYLHRTEEFLNDEIVKIKDEKWRTCLPSITLESFLQEKGPIAYSMMSKQNREAVDDFFQNNGTILNQEFPELDSILLLQYREARARVELIQLAYNCLGLVVGFDMPFLCAEAIFKFLRNSDLKNIIVASSLE